MNKTELRQKLRRIVVDLPESVRAEQSKKACEHLLNTDEYNNASVVMIFLSLPHEVDTTMVILDAWQKGKTVAVPKVSWQQRHMLPVEINSLEVGFSTEAGGFKNPITGVPVPLEDIDLVVTPGLAFDIHGGRLGRGGAYYDRFFASKLLKAKKCGFAFKQQIIDDIPMENHDVPVDCIVTDEGMIECER